MTHEISDNTVPLFNKTFRIQWESAQNTYVILYPEGMVKLNTAAGEILSRCDGQKSVACIIKELEALFPDADTITTDVLTFLSTAYEKQWIEFRAT